MGVVVHRYDLVCIGPRPPESPRPPETSSTVPFSQSSRQLEPPLWVAKGALEIERGAVVELDPAVDGRAAAVRTPRRG